MLCGACGAPLLPVYSAEGGWKCICSKCSSEVKAAPSGLATGLGEKAYQAFRQYQDGEYEQAEELFFALARQTECLDYTMACYWHAILSRYGFVYAKCGLDYIIYYLRFPLPDTDPSDSEAWKKLRILSSTLSCCDKVFSEMDMLRAAISALKDAPSGQNEVYINWDFWDGRDGQPRRLAEKLAHELMVTGHKTVRCFMPQMDNSNLQNYAASVYNAMRNASLMVVIIGKEGMKEKTPFSLEANAFWKKSGLNCGRIMVCADHAGGAIGLTELLPDWMLRHNWQLEWILRSNEPMDMLVHAMRDGICSKLNRLSERTESPDRIQRPEQREKSAWIDPTDHVESVFAHICETLQRMDKDTRYSDYGWVPEAERIWDETEDARFGALLLGYYVRVARNRYLARECYDRLNERNALSARKALNSQEIKAFLQD